MYRIAYQTRHWFVFQKNFLYGWSIILNDFGTAVEHSFTKSVFGQVETDDHDDLDDLDDPKVIVVIEVIVVIVFEWPLFHFFF